MKEKTSKVEKNLKEIEVLKKKRNQIEIMEMKESMSQLKYIIKRPNRINLRGGNRGGENNSHRHIYRGGGQQVWGKLPKSPFQEAKPKEAGMAEEAELKSKT